MLVIWGSYASFPVGNSPRHPGDHLKGDLSPHKLSGCPEAILEIGSPLTVCSMAV